VNQEKFRTLLLAKKEELVSLALADEDGRKPVTLDQTSVGRLSRMDALQSQAMSLEIDRRRRQELLRIDAAIARLDLGEYGYCIVCGDEIPEKRLTFDPSATTCVVCAGSRS